jgi:hypothetical protein
MAMFPDGPGTLKESERHGARRFCIDNPSAQAGRNRDRLLRSVTRSRFGEIRGRDKDLVVRDDGLGVEDSAGTIEVQCPRIEVHARTK